MKWSVGQSATAADQRGVARMLRHWLAHPPDAHFDDVLRTVAQKALDVSHEDVQNELDVNSQHRLTSCFKTSQTRMYMRAT